MEGINSVLENYPDIKVLYTQPADWMRDLAMQTMENWLQLGEQIDGVVAHNDEMALGAYDAIKDAGLEKDIKVIGLDAIPAALESVKGGELIATVLQANEEIGRKAIDIALALAKGETVDETYYIPFVLITQDNVDEYL
jgi:ABC-type sugar transport system substrate-binding protein